MPICTIHGLDLATLGCKVSRVEGMGSLPTVRLPLARIPGRMGQTALGLRAGEGAARAVTVILTLRPRSLSAMETALEQLYAVCGGGLVSIQDGRDPAKVAWGRLESSEERAYDPQYLATDPASQITLRFTCEDPTRYDVSGLTLGLPVAGTAYEIPLGNRACAPVARIRGPVTNPGLVYREASGTARCTLGYTITLGANDWLEHNHDTGAIRKSVAGTITDAYSTWTTRSDGLLVLDPHDGDPVLGAGPTAEVTGSGASGALFYVRAWA